MKVSDLSGALLDIWVARSNGWTHAADGSSWVDENGACQYHPACCYDPSSDWSLGGPIIERDQIFIEPPSVVHYNGGPNSGWRRYDHWRATVSARTRTLPPNETQQALRMRGGVGRGAGETPLIAAMRAKVASHYGDEVPDVEGGEA
jgi:hypothetical protein